ncbi:MAG TPA: MBL fold metallo-hydrolase [Galbitalea sp.]|jgi:glyoxylase-like metal-dependent hydrolase (beta-lactamase superfamily II)|nr:MBL fold metallo-hydrolase [Galbitalea sp.]
MTIDSELIVPGVRRIRDTCNVYLIEGADGQAIAIDFGSGIVLELADSLGLTLTDVLMTHHHRDQGQGLPFAAERGVRIHVPPVEVELFRNVEEMWLSRRLENDYNLRQDRFSLLDSVPISSTVPEYREVEFAGIVVRTIPTPGHTMGSVSYLVRIEDAVLAFSGDLIFAPGKVWSLAATQWSYSNQEGPAMTVLSSYLLSDERPDVLLPSHGEVMRDAAAALTELAEAMQEYVDSRRSYPWALEDRLRKPFRSITEHLLLNRSSMSCSYVILSTTGEALLVDFGYDMTTGILNETERSARRPWLASLPALREQYGVTNITVGLPTHYHDDHLAGFPLLRDVEQTEIWVPENFAPIIADPLRFDLPCQWFDPIGADKVLPLGKPFTWNEYTITPHELPGHTRYAVAYEVTIDDITVLFTGDQQEGLGGPGERRDIMNYQYRNLFALGDYRRSAALYQRVAPGLIVTGHWEPRWVEDGYLDYLGREGQFIDDIHQRLLPLDQYDLPADSILARIAPYRSFLAPGATSEYVVTLRNPLPDRAVANVSLVVPDGWATTSAQAADVESGETLEMAFSVTVGRTSARRARIAAEVTIGELRLGQHAEALVDVVTKP